jgi:hypothetical protein
MNDRILIAPDGYVYTNGTAYGKTIELGCNDKADNWRLITESECEKLFGGSGNDHEAM